MGNAYVTGALIETRAPNWVVTVTSALHMRHFFHWAPQIFITWREFRKGLDNQRKQKNVISEKIFSVLPLLNYCNYNGGLISASITYCEQASSAWIPASYRKKRISKSRSSTRKLVKFFLDSKWKYGVISQSWLPTLRLDLEHCIISNSFPSATNICFSRFQVYATTNPT